MDQVSHSADEAKSPAPQSESKIVPFSSWVPYAIAACLMLVVMGQAARITALKAQIALNETELTRLTQSNDMKDLRLTALDARDTAYQSSRIMVAWDPFQHRGVIAMQNLPAPAPGRNYQLWVLDPGAQTPVSAGLIHPETGSSSFSINRPSTINPGFAITLEPAEGSPQPTGSILFAVAPGN